MTTPVVSPEAALIFELLKTGGSAGTLAVVVVAWLRGWVVSGRDHERLRADRDFWRDTALAALKVGEMANDRAH